MAYENEALVCNVLLKKYGEKGRDFKFKSRNIARELGLSSYAVRNVLKKMEKEKTVKRTELSSTATVWQTNFNGKKDVCECGDGGVSRIG